MSCLVAAAIPQSLEDGDLILNRSALNRGTLTSPSRAHPPSKVTSQHINVTVIITTILVTGTPTRMGLNLKSRLQKSRRECSTTPYPRLQILVGVA